MWSAQSSPVYGTAESDASSSLACCWTLASRVVPSSIVSLRPGVSPAAICESARRAVVASWSTSSASAPSWTVAASTTGSTAASPAHVSSSRATVPGTWPMVATMPAPPSAMSSATAIHATRTATVRR